MQRPELQVEVPLGDLLMALIDYRGKTPSKAASGVRLITAKVIKNGRIDTSTAEYISNDTYLTWMRRGIPERGDILVTTEAPLGEVAQLRTDERVALAQRVILLRPNPRRVNPQFLFHFLRSDEALMRMRQRSSGTTVSGIRQPELRAVRIPMLSNRQQAGSAAILDAFDDLIEINERRIELLEGLARSLYHEWFVRFRFPGHEDAMFVESDLGRIPDGWRVCTLSDIAEPRVEGVAIGDVDVGCPYVGLEHLPRRSTTLRGWGGIESVKSRKLRFRRRDTLFGKIRPYFHKVVWAPFDGVASSDTIIMRPREEHALPALVNATLSSDTVVAEAVATSNGTRMPRADPAVLLRYPLALPALDGHLVTAFEHATSRYLEFSAALVAQNHTLAASRDLILPRLVTGRLDISDIDLGDLLPEEIA